MAIMRDEVPVLWLDLETTGSDYTRDVILEVGAILTDAEFSPVGTEFHALIRPPIDFALESIDPVVRQMHDESGLWNDLNVLPLDSDNWRTDTRMYAWLVSTLADINAYAPWGVPSDKQYDTVVMAGSGVSHFDSKFVQKYLPLVWASVKGFHHEVKPTLDIGVVRRFLKYADVDLQVPDFTQSFTPHRALEDVKNFIFTAQWYRDRFRELDPAYRDGD